MDNTFYLTPYTLQPSLDQEIVTLISVQNVTNYLTYLTPTSFGIVLRIISKTYLSKLGKLAVDGAFGSYSEASGGRLASLAYPPTRRFARPNYSLSGKKFGAIKKKLKKKIGKI